MGGGPGSSTPGRAAGRGPSAAHHLGARRHHADPAHGPEARRLDGFASVEAELDDPCRRVVGVVRPEVIATNGLPPLAIPPTRGASSGRRAGSCNATAAGPPAEWAAPPSCLASPPPPP